MKTFITVVSLDISLFITVILKLKRQLRNDEIYTTQSLFVVLVGNDMYELVLFQLPQMTCAFI